MSKLEYLQFAALMLPTILVVILAVVSIIVRAEIPPAVNTAGAYVTTAQASS